MFRKTLTAVAVAAALTLAACGSSGGEAQSGSTAGAESGASAGSVAGTQVAPSTGSADGASAGSASAGSAGESGATITVGGDIDAQTATWFSAFCDGMSSMKSGLPSMMPTGTAMPDPDSMKQSYVEFLNALGDAMINTANKLKPLPPPTFDKGSEIASKLVDGMSKAGPAMKQSAEKLSATKVSDQAELQAALSEATGNMEENMSTIELNNYQLDDKTKAALSQLPACAPMMNVGDDSDPVEPTG